MYPGSTSGDANIPNSFNFSTVQFFKVGFGMLRWIRVWDLILQTFRVNFSVRVKIRNGGWRQVNEVSDYLVLPITDTDKLVSTDNGHVYAKNALGNQSLDIYTFIRLFTLYWHNHRAVGKLFGIAWLASFDNIINRQLKSDMCMWHMLQQFTCLWLCSKRNISLTKFN